MNTASFIRQSLETSRELALGLANDLRDSPLVQPTATGGNHALWILGHMTYRESTLQHCRFCTKPVRIQRLVKLDRILARHSRPENSAPMTTTAAVKPTSNVIAEGPLF